MKEIYSKSILLSGWGESASTLVPPWRGEVWPPPPSLRPVRRSIPSASIQNKNSPIQGYFHFERVRGVEPLSRLWKSRVIPLYDTRNVQISSKFYAAETLNVQFAKQIYVLTFRSRGTRIRTETKPRPFSFGYSKLSAILFSAKRLTGGFARACGRGAGKRNFIKLRKNGVLKIFSCLEID